MICTVLASDNITLLYNDGYLPTGIFRWGEDMRRRLFRDDAYCKLMKLIVSKMREEI